MAMQRRLSTFQPSVSLDSTAEKKKALLKSSLRMKPGVQPSPRALYQQRKLNDQRYSRAREVLMKSRNRGGLPVGPKVSPPLFDDPNNPRRYPAGGLSPL